MAKAAVKKAVKSASKKAAISPAKAKKTATVSIDKVMPQVLAKLEGMNAEHQLQSEIKWCIGSYEFDRNPKGLYETGAKALQFFAHAKANKVKGIPTKLVTDLEKALKPA
ncbi:MAG TPA: hypothetical protein VIS49_09060 [Cyclobacteriaceae bacterium]